MSPALRPCLILIGDLHDDPTAVLRADREYPAGVPLLQVGDLTWTSRRVRDWTKIAADLARPLYFLRGNHDDPTLLGPAIDASQPVPLGHQLFFLPDGITTTIGGLHVGVMGGASSIDRRDREPLGTWWPEEVPSERTWARASAMGTVDLLVTHCPPATLIDAIADPRMPPFFGLPATWRDPVAGRIEALWHTLGRPPLVAGHMHRPYRLEAERVVLLGLEEVMPWPSTELG
jgi:hypothetical protein